MAEPRNATGTPIRELFADADRMAELDERLKTVEELSAILASAIAELAALACGHDTRLEQRIDAIERQRRNDVRLSAVLRGIEQRLRKVELGGEVMP